MLIAPNVPHFWQVAPECPKAEVLYIQFLPNFPGSEFFNLPELKTVCDLLNAAHCGMTFGPSIRKQASSRLNQFPALNKPERLFAFLETLYRLSQDVDIRPLGKAKNPIRLNRRDEERISKVFQYLNQNLTTSISQAEIAASIRLSSAAFSRLFKKTTGKCFMEVVNELRIAQVCRLLAETDRTISEIAYECGFESLSNFHSQFRTVMKMPPRKYRERIAAIAPGMRGRCDGGLRQSP